MPVLLALIAWLILYIPVYGDLAVTAWRREENAHGALMLIIVFGTIFVRLWGVEKRNTGHTFLTVQPSDLWLGGCLVLISGLFLFVGQVEQLDLLTTGSQVPMLAGIILCLGGWRLLRLLWFPVLMTTYLIVWPGWAIDQLTGPLKIWISSFVADLVTLADLPVAASGVILAIGSYKLQIADACAGLNSLISLTATGAIYLYVARKPGKARNVLVFLSTLPLAIFANIIRVLLLVLITYYWGYDAGQGFVHMLAGFVMFAVALAGVFFVDWLADKKWPLPRGVQTAQVVT